MPRLNGPSETIYDLRPGTWVQFQVGLQIRVLQLRKVERPWKDTERDPHENGKSPCLAHFDGEPKPYYFASGWDRVMTIPQHASIDF